MYSGEAIDQGDRNRDGRGPGDPFPPIHRSIRSTLSDTIRIEFWNERGIR